MTATLEAPVADAGQLPIEPAAPVQRRLAWSATNVSKGFDTLSPTSFAVIGSLIIVGVLALWFVLFGLVLSGFQESRTQKQLYTDFRTQIAGEVAPLGGVVATGTPPQDVAVAQGAPVSLLSIPAAGLSDAIVVEGTTSADLAKGPGLLRTSVLPGQAGVSVIYGKSVLYGGPFHKVPALRKGALITAVTQQGTFTYVVDRVRRAGDPVVPVATGASRLVLVTSQGSGWRSGWAAQQTVYVDASLKGKPTVTLGGQPSSVAPNEMAMAGDTERLILIVLGLQALFVVTLGGIYAFNRWGATQTYVVMLPVTVALLWWCSDQVALLLPNLL